VDRAGEYGSASWAVVDVGDISVAVVGVLGVMGDVGREEPYVQDNRLGHLASLSSAESSVCRSMTSLTLRKLLRAFGPANA
jgi:hypothetical protein